MKHRQPNRVQRAVVTTSLPLATAAAVATLLAAPAGAAPVPVDVPTTPAAPPAQAPAPANDNTGPTTQSPAPAKPGSTTQPGVTQAQPGVTTPNTGAPQPDQNLAGPVQPGVTSPRVAPLPVPGEGPAQPVIMPQPGPTPNQPVPPQAGPDASQPGQGNNSPAQMGTGPAQPVQPTQPSWSSPSLRSAPAAPIIHMTGPHTEVGANVDGGPLAPGYVANTHHFNNAQGYVGTVGYRTPTGTGDAGVSVEYIEPNRIKVTTYTHTTGIDDLKAKTGFNDIKNTTYVDTTQANAAKAAVEGWIRMQPGGVAALDAAAHVGRLPQGNYAPQTVNVAGATAQVSGSVQG
ncbi:hypothetical protein [Nocardia albiluteola]|uniref:hypothetical protein n=1 Tax=Nocardia albiluteola TaxID=2842303 RepID=UPI0027DF5480|nr:hypothetical protein [Nocardia albiluteola]